MGTISDKITYLNETKTKIKDAINLMGANITDDTFRSYPDKIKTKLVDFMNNGTEEIWNNWNKVTGSGTEITLDNTEEAPMKIDYKGNTSQYTTTGKNIWNILETLAGTTMTTSDNIVYQLQTTTNNRTYTINGEENTAYTCDITIKGGANGEDIYLYFVYSDSSQDNIGYFTGSSSTETKRLTKTSNSSKTLVGILLQTYNVGNKKDYTFTKPILVKGTYTASNIPDYEPYTGGKASPNPDYPQEVKVVKGDNVIKIEGKNYCNGINQNVYLNQAVTSCGIANDNSGLYIKVNGGNYTISTTATQTRYRVACSNVIPPSIGSASCYNGQNKDGTSNSITIDTTGYEYLIVNATDLTKIQIEKGSQATSFTSYEEPSEYKISLSSENLLSIPLYQFNTNTLRSELPNFKAGTYTFSFEMVNTAGNQVTARKIVDGVNTQIKALYNQNVLTFDLDEDATLQLEVYKTGILLNEVTDAILKSGSYANGYIPYYQPIELCELYNYKDTFIKPTGKNVFNSRKIVQQIVTSMTIFDDNSMQLVYTGNETYRNVRFRIDNVKPNTDYKFRAKYTCSNTNLTTLWVQISALGNIQLFNASYTSNTAISFNSGDNTSLYVRIYAVGSTAGVNTATWTDIEIVEASKFGDFEPYGTEWRKKEKIKKITFDGTENWVYQSSYDLTNTKQFTFLNAIRLPETLYQGLSNYFKRTTGWSTLVNTDEQMIQFYMDKAVYIRIDSTKASDLATFKTWLGNHNTDLYYINSNTEYILLPDTLQNQLNKIVHSKKSQTNISQENDGLPFELDVSALESI